MRSEARVALASLAAAACLLCAPTGARAAFQDFASLGVAVKCGESAGVMGAQLSWNFSPHWQATVGVGGANPLSSVFEAGRFRTDSYFILAKHYFKHLYLAAGYSYDFAKVRMEDGGVFYERSGAEHGLPVHLGYEFGKRNGFYFATSIGFVFIPGGGGRELRLTSQNGTSSVEYQTPSTGPSVGLTLGYYFPGIP